MTADRDAAGGEQPQDAPQWTNETLLRPVPLALGHHDQTFPHLNVTRPAWISYERVT